MNHFQPFADPFSDEALGQRTPEAIAQDDRQEADLRSIQAADMAAMAHACGDPECLCDGLKDARYHAALVVIANEEGAGRYARAINLVAKIWGKTENEVLTDAVML